jgi:hypothetical protein
VAQELYSTEEIIRQGLMNVGEKNVKDSFITQAIAWASSDCDFLSGKVGWQANDTFYGTIAGCCEQLAVCYAIGLQNDKDARQMNLFKMVLEKLGLLKTSLISAGIITLSGTGGITAGLSLVPKQTYPMNHAAGEIYAAKRKGIISTERDTSTEMFITSMDNSDFV